MYKGGDFLKKHLPVLRNSSFFSGMSDDEILSVLHCVDARTVTRKNEEYIFHAGESISEMGLVLSGSVLVVQEDVWGRRNIMSRIEAGDIFAESYAATPGSVLNISAVACERCEILLLNVGRLLTVCPFRLRTSQPADPKPCHRSFSQGASV